MTVDKIFCAHGGLSKAIIEGSLDTINAIKRPVKDVDDSELVRDILWSDPHKSEEGLTQNYARKGRFVEVVQTTTYTWHCFNFWFCSFDLLWTR